MMSKTVEGEIYHIYNRGVEKRDIFLDDRDRLRFIYGLALFNTPQPSLNAGRTFNAPLIEVQLQSRGQEKLVEIMAFCLMSNHYHLMLRGLVPDGIKEFMRKIGTGYTNYFNLKYQRVGSLFQGRYKAKPVLEEQHFIYLPFYIHTNPLGADDRSSTSIKKLEEYRWSSFHDYIGKPNFPYVLDQTFLNQFFETPERHYRDTIAWLSGDSAQEIGSLAFD